MGALYETAHCSNYSSSPDNIWIVKQSSVFLEKRRPFLNLLIEAAGNGTLLGDDDISDEVNTFLFAVKPHADS